MLQATNYPTRITCTMNESDESNHNLEIMPII